MTTPNTVLALADRPFFCSWSGGKDSCLALQRASAAGGTPAALLCMLDEDGERSRGHGIPLPVLRDQADALGLDLVTRATSWDDYERHFLDAITGLRACLVADGVFGDIDLQEHRDWVERVCGQAGVQAHLPLWQEPRRVLLDELLSGRVRSTIVALRPARLDAALLGRELDAATIVELEAAGADPCGEEGEYHTMVTDGPLFSRPVALSWRGTVSREDCLVLDIDAATADIA